MKTKLKGKETTITDREMMDIIIEDLKEMDVYVYMGLIEYLYPVVVSLDDGFVTIKPKDIDQFNLEDIF